MKRGAKGFTLGELLLVFLIAVIIGAIMLPFIRYSQGRMDKIVCANNLREVGLAMYIYAREHEGRFPQTLQALYDEHYLADKKLMDCPGSVSVGTPEEPDYVYTTGLTVRDPSLEVLVRDKEKNHREGGRNVLYVNGEVTWREEN